MTLLVDTNAYSAMRRGHALVAERMRCADRVLVSVFVLGELLYGFRAGTRYQENVAGLRQFLAEPWVDVLPVTRTTADHFSRIASALREQGRPIPQNDMWLAAQAMETGAELLSSDRHFAEVDGLRWSTFGQE